MPYQGTNDIFDPVPPDATLWRYMDFTKFASLLDREALFFARADNLGDPFEGSSPRRHAELRPEWEMEQGYPEGLFDDLADVRRLAPQHTFVTAWHMNEVESDAMWRLYLTSAEGIAIRTTFKRFCDALVNAEQQVFGGAVRYVDYETATIPEGNTFWPFAHKRLSFEHEREVRGVFDEFQYYQRIRARMSPEYRERAFAAEGIEDGPDVDLDEVLPLAPPGIYVPVVLGTLIESVYVAPTAAAWFAELVESLMRRFDRNEPVVRSTLLDEPTY
jgi:hypothetical protein